MIDEGRYCLDEIQQANAVVAAMREVELLIISTQSPCRFNFGQIFERHMNKRLKSFCVTQPMQKLRWTEPSQ
jgi:hypothetical protein